MFFYASKLLSFLTYPAVWIMALLLFAFFTKNGRKRKRLVLITLLLFYLLSNSFINSIIMRWWETDPVHQKDLASRYDAAIILGGFTSYDEEYEMTGFHESADRFLHPLRLYKKGIVKKLMLVGGSGSIMDDQKESLIIRDFLVEIGIPEEDIILETHSKNTRENAVNTAGIIENRFPEGKFLLVTSAYHMRRANACFEKAGIDADIYSTDLIAGPVKWQFDYFFIPESRNFSYWHILLHEWLGYSVYAMFGYV